MKPKRSIREVVAAGAARFDGRPRYRASIAARSELAAQPMTARPKSVWRTVGRNVKLEIIGEVGGAALTPRDVASITIDGCWRVDLTRSEARQLRDALSKILGDGAGR